MAYNNTVPENYPQQQQTHETAPYQSNEQPVDSVYHHGPTAYAANPTASYESNNINPQLNSNMAPTYNEATGTSTNPGNVQTTDMPGDGKDRGSHIVGGSSTGAPALPSRTARTEYSRENSSYNPATGTGFTPQHRREQVQQQQPAGTTSQQASGSATATTAPTASGDNKTGQKIGEGIRDTFATIHGAGESLRGNINAAIDRAFNQPEGVAKNEAIGREGEYEAQSGQFSASTKQREGFNTGNRKV